MQTTNEIRQAFIDYFVGKGHRHVASSSLVPGGDGTLLFTNSGMVQFKDTFLGAEKRDYTRAASAQRCVRAGGKHNDLDAVGYTARHHTFFEMLGNFSFGDYFKRDAIHYAWELLTGVYRLPKDKLWVTVYQTDDEAFDIWAKEVGVPVERIVRIGDNKGAPFASDNFWQMADTGPCGPCSEIFYDHGEGIEGGPPGSPEADGDRYIEIWNLVFMQFDRSVLGSTEYADEAAARAAYEAALAAGKVVQPPTASRSPAGELKYTLTEYRMAPLPSPCVDTGMGLERLTAVLQHVHSNYEIDLFQALIRACAALTGTADLANPSLRVIADHIRACSFLIVDGVLPSNEGRGYVLRRIIRRALRHGWKLGVRQAFFHRMVAPLVEQMGKAYPELAAKATLVDQVLAAEEERFAETLDSGMKVFEQIAAKASGTVAGADAFRLYDTYGFPVDLTADVARERGLRVDMDAFEEAMAAQRERARSASNFGGGVQVTAEHVEGLAPTIFTGYESGECGDARVLRLLVDGKLVQQIVGGDRAVVILDRTPFYAESGGQVGDEGQLAAANAAFAVEDTIKLAGVFHGHLGQLREGVLKVGDTVSAQIDGARRRAIVLNHSATHLLHAALREELGTHVQQKGSLVAPDRLRFDFSHFQPITPDQLKRIETRVNQQVRANAAAEVHHMGMQQALDFGAMALFGEKYGDHVRVLKMGDFSTELCGGTHVERAGDIGLFKIVSEGGISAGVRRIEAITGAAAVAWVQEQEGQLRELAGLLGAGDQVIAKVQQLLDRIKRDERELAALKSKAASASVDDMLAHAADVGGVKVLAERIEGVDAKVLREMLDKIKQKLVDAVVVLASAQDGKATLIAGVSGAALGRIKAGDVLGHVAAAAGGKGGGRPDMAQGGCPDVPALQAALAGLKEFVAARA
ncbi:MAG: alanine--tRNA ligase [Rhodanobacteraceae bacterium]|nr:alanine--tRNA ligase [Rhodanobacteraceae bacterium]